MTNDVSVVAFIYCYINVYTLGARVTQNLHKQPFYGSHLKIKYFFFTLHFVNETNNMWLKILAMIN